jgi:hypothetical protein
MFKKIAMACAFIATASFATWDYYPVLEAGKGSFAGGLYYDWHHDWSQAGLKIGARYSIIQNLEISVQSFGYQFWSEEDCDGCVNGGDGLRDLTIGGRYIVAPMVTAFLDMNLPIGGDEVSSDEIALYAGAQFSVPTNVPGFKFGTEGGIFWGFEHDNSERGLEIHLGGEVAYTVPNVGVTPFAGLQLKYRLTESTWEDGEGRERGGNDDGDSQVIIWLGAGYFVIPNQLDLKAQLFVRSGDHGNMGGYASGLYVGAEFFF